MESMGLFYTAPNTPYFFEKRVLTTCPTVKLRVQHIHDQRILFPLTKEQKTIYKAFAVKDPV